MRKALFIFVLLVIILSSTVALAADGVLYRDDELGFSLEMPSDYEYYGDVLQESVELVDVDTEGMEKQPMYTGLDSNINIVYVKDTDGFDKYEKNLPDGITRDEIDLYLFENEERREAEIGRAHV